MVILREKSFSFLSTKTDLSETFLYNKMFSSFICKIKDASDNNRDWFRGSENGETSSFQFRGMKRRDERDALIG